MIEMKSEKILTCEIFRFNEKMEKYRYYLSREWGEESALNKCLVAIMLNPSYASYLRGDGTVDFLMEFFDEKGFKKLIVLNLFAYKTPKPKELINSDEELEKDNVLERYFNEADEIFVGWGKNEKLCKESLTFKNMFDKKINEVVNILKNKKYKDKVHCFKNEKGDKPMHPSKYKNVWEYTKFF